MASTFKWAQTNGAGSGTTTDLTGGDNNLFNYKNTDSAGTTGYDTYPIVAGTNSYEVWLRGHWTGDFNKIDNLKFWMSQDFSPNTGLTIKWKGNGVTTYSQPTNETSTIATSAIPTSAPDTANVSIGGSLTGALTTEGYSDYIVSQLQTTVQAQPGDTSLAEFTLSYDES